MHPQHHTDREWEKWGKSDPYYGVVSWPQFRQSAINEQSRQDFFLTGQRHVDHVIEALRTHLRPSFAPTRILDYGCGVGRLVVPFAQRFQHVTGVDVSEAMLSEARANAKRAEIENVQYFHTDQFEMEASKSFDLIHSFIVFQHIRPNRGEAILRRLLQLLEPEGLGAIHITFSKDISRLHSAVSEVRKRSTAVHRTMNLLYKRPFKDPSMEMNMYSLNHIFTILFKAGCGSIYTEFSRHNNANGLMLYFEKIQLPLL